MRFTEGKVDFGCAGLNFKGPRRKKSEPKDSLCFNIAESEHSKVCYRGLTLIPYTYAYTYAYTYNTYNTYTYT